MNHLKFSWIAAIVLFFSANSFAQVAPLLKTWGVGPLVAKPYKKMEGSPFYYEQYTPGTVSLENGKTFRDLKLQYDQVTNEINFIYQNEEPLVFTDRVISFTLSPETGGNLRFIRDIKADFDKSEDSFFLVLADGNARLLKKTAKYISEDKPFGSATIVQKIMSNEALYVYHNGKAVKVKDRKGIIELLSDKKSQLEEYSRTNEIGSRDEASLIKLINYYNSLHS